MQRPTLNPSMFEDADRDARLGTPRGELEWALGRLLRQSVRGVWRAARESVRIGLRLLMTPVHPVRHAPTRNVPHVGGWVAPVLFRVTFALVLLLACVAALVQWLAYPPGLSRADAPACAGLFAEPVRLTAMDGVSSDAWRVHAIDADAVMRRPAAAARAKWPAVVLVPGLPGDGHELDALVLPLHRRGYVVLVLRTRGPLSGDESPHTFGLNERLDVTAAVAHVRALSYVDASRVSVIGSGTGATAALLSLQNAPASQRPTSTLVFNVPNDFDDVLVSHKVPHWLGRACRWAFEVSQRVDTDELSSVSLLRQPSVTLLATSPARAGSWPVVMGAIESKRSVDATSVTR